MKKWGFWLFLLVFFIPNFVYASLNKTVSNPYQITGYTLTSTSNNVVWNSSSNNSNIRNIEFGNNVEYRFTANVDFLSNASDSSLDIGDAVLFSNDDTDLLYYIVPMCFNKLDFNIEMLNGTCPACLENNVSIMVSGEKNCSFVDSSDFVGPIQYLSDPYDGYLVYLTFKVKQWRVDNNLLHGTANDRFKIYNVESNTPLVYRFLNDDGYNGGLYDSNGKNMFGIGLQTIQQRQMLDLQTNGKYQCTMSNNIMGIDYTNSDIWDDDLKRLKFSNSILYRNQVDDKNLLDVNSMLGKSLSYNGSNYVFTNGEFRQTNDFNVYISSGTYYLSANIISNNTDRDIRLLVIYDDATSQNYALNQKVVFSRDVVRMRLFVYSGGTNGDIIFNNLQLEKGSSISDYVPYSLPTLFIDLGSLKTNVTYFNFYDTNVKQKGLVYFGAIKLSTSKVQYLHDIVTCGLLNEKCWYSKTTSAQNDILFWSTKAEYRYILLQTTSFNEDIYFDNPFFYNENEVNDAFINNPFYSEYGQYYCTNNDTGIVYQYDGKNEYFNPNNGLAISDNPYFSMINDVPIYGLSYLASVPVTFLTSVKEGACEPISLSFNIRGQIVNAVTLPCGQQFWSRNDLRPFLPFITLFCTGGLAYGLGYFVYRLVLKARKPGHLYMDGVDMGEIADL